MQLVDEIFKSFKEYHHLDDLKKLNSRAERFEKIRANAVNRNKLPVSFIPD